MNLRAVPIATCVLLVLLRVARAYDDNRLENAIRVFQKLSHTRHGISSLRNIVNDLDQDLFKTQKRTCLVGGGLSHHCALVLADNKLNVHNWLKNGLSPGRRRRALPLDKDEGENSMADKDGDSSYDSFGLFKLRKIKDLSRRRKGLDILRQLLDQLDADLIIEQKRNCRLNLGGHCATENAAAVADQWHYLNSPLSPGRKRRDTQMYKNVINGKVLE